MIRIASRLALICSVSFLCTSIACTTGQSPNVEVQFVTPSVGWIVGPRLLQTTDAGKTWVELRREGYGTLEAEDIFQGRNWTQFLTHEVGFSVGGSGVAKTSDGGRTWSSTVVTDGQDQSLASLFFLSPQEGWVIGKDVYHTSDAGQHWRRLSKTPIGEESRQRNLGIAPTYAVHSPALWFINSKRGLMARLDGEIYATSDGGNTWEMVWRTDKVITDIFFINNDGWVVGRDGLVARAMDGGGTWLLAQIPAKLDLNSVFFINKQIGWAVGDKSAILYTKDSGITWKTASIVGSGGLPPLASVSFVDESHGWAVGGNSDPSTPSFSSPSNLVLATEDGGNTWRSIQPN